MSKPKTYADRLAGSNTTDCAICGITRPADCRNRHCSLNPRYRTPPAKRRHRSRFRGWLW